MEKNDIIRFRLNGKKYMGLSFHLNTLWKGKDLPDTLMGLLQNPQKRKPWPLD